MREQQNESQKKGAQSKARQMLGHIKINWAMIHFGIRDMVESSALFQPKKQFRCQASDFHEKPAQSYHVPPPARFAEEAFKNSRNMGRNPWRPGMTVVKQLNEEKQGLSGVTTRSKLDAQQSVFSWFYASLMLFRNILEYRPSRGRDMFQCECNGSSERQRTSTKQLSLQNNNNQTLE